MEIVQLEDITLEELSFTNFYSQGITDKLCYTHSLYLRLIDFDNQLSVKFEHVKKNIYGEQTFSIGGYMIEDMSENKKDFLKESSKKFISQIKTNGRIYCG